MSTTQEQQNALQYILDFLNLEMGFYEAPHPKLEAAKEQVQKAFQELEQWRVLGKKLQPLIEEMPQIAITRDGEYRMQICNYCHETASISSYGYNLDPPIVHDKECLLNNIPVLRKALEALRS